MLRAKTTIQLRTEVAALTRLVIVYVLHIITMKYVHGTNMPDVMTDFVTQTLFH